MSCWKHVTIGLLGGILTLSMSVADVSATEHSAAIAQLEARADRLTRELVLPPKKGIAHRSEIQNQRRAIHEEIERLADGGTLDASRVASLLGQESRADDPESLANLAEGRQEALERRLLTGPRMGVATKSQLRREIDDLDGMIAALERGEDVDSRRINDLLGMMIARAPLTAEERLRDRKYQLATLERRLGAGRKHGVVTRAKIRDEIEKLDAMIDRLEDAQGR